MKKRVMDKKGQLAEPALPQKDVVRLFVPSVVCVFAAIVFSWANPLVVVLTSLGVPSLSWISCGFAVLAIVLGVVAKFKRERTWSVVGNGVGVLLFNAAFLFSFPLITFGLSVVGSLGALIFCIKNIRNEEKKGWHWFLFVCTLLFLLLQIFIGILVATGRIRVE